MLRTSTEASTAINKVHQNPGVSLCLTVAFLTLSYYQAFVLNKSFSPEEKHCPSLRGQGESQREKKKVRYLDSYSPNQLSVALYYVCKAKSWPEKTTCHRIRNINTTLKYLYFVLWFLYLNKWSGEIRFKITAPSSAAQKQGWLR